MKRYIINNIKSLVLASAACVGMASCGDFLYIEPKTFVSEDNFWNEKTDIDQMVAGLYVKMQSSDFIGRCITWGEVRSDNTAAGQNTTNNVDLDRTLKENLLSTNSYCIWTSFYSVINAANTIIARADEVSEKDPTFTHSDAMATKAECSFVRALSYFYLVRAFENVPYYEMAIQSDDDIPNLPVTNGDEIINNLIKDLEYYAPYALKAYPKDNDHRFNSNCNRATQNSIYSLLTDLCLWSGDYQKSVDYAQKVIDAKFDEYMEDYATNVNTSNGSPVLFKHADDPSVGYPLYPCFSGSTYGNDFNKIFGGDMNSFESIFELAFTPSQDNDPQYIANSTFDGLYGSDRNGGNQGKGQLGVNEMIVSDIASKTTGDIFTRYDIRYYCNLYNEGLAKGEFEEAFISKYVKGGVNVQLAQNATLPYAPTWTRNTISDRNFIFYRLTDVMLMQAEALIELGHTETVTDEESGKDVVVMDDNLKQAFYLIWAVNRRAIIENTSTKVPSVALKDKDYTTKEALEELVLNERRKELMFEGKRWFDLLRLCHRDKSTSPIKTRVQAKGVTTSSTTLFTNYESLYWPYHKIEVRDNPYIDQKPFYGSTGENNNYATTN